MWQLSSCPYTYAQALYHEDFGQSQEVNNCTHLVQVVWRRPRWSAPQSSPRPTAPLSDPTAWTPEPRLPDWTPGRGANARWIEVSSKTKVFDFLNFAKTLAKNCFQLKFLLCFFILFEKRHPTRLHKISLAFFAKAPKQKKISYFRESFLENTTTKKFRFDAYHEAFVEQGQIYFFRDMNRNILEDNEKKISKKNIL